jgi:hypothetical protein
MKLPQSMIARRFGILVYGCLLLLPVTACRVVESSRIAPQIETLGPSNACASGLGSYVLPKAFLHVTVTQAPSATPAIGNIETSRHNDPSLVFCLDYLASYFAHDTITVRKWAFPPSQDKSQAPPQPPTSFLGVVIINNIDRSAYVFEALIRAAFIAVSGNPAFRDDTIVAATLVDFEYDPFDPDESAVINARLTKLGYCLVLEGYTFDRQTPDVSSYCNSPKGYPNRHTFVTKAYLKAEATPADRQLPGLLYRPRMPYRLEIYNKPDKADYWRLVKTQSVDLENLSPVLALDIRRAAFAQRTATFIFERGTLKAACVSKSSELEGFVDIPLQISKSIVALPASILSVQLDQVTNQTKLIDAERQLYQVQKAFLSAQANGKYVPVDGVAAPAAFTAPTVPSVTDGLAAAPAGPGYDSFNDPSLKKLCQDTP